MAVESKRVVAILLAAGRSERFGRDKLAEPYEGVPLAHYAARTLAEIDFARRVAVVGPTSVAFMPLGFDIVRPLKGSAMSASIAVGVHEAIQTDCDACLIALADMPFVPADHFQALMRAHQNEATATLVGFHKMVPALFGRSMFSVLCKLEGDRGASAYLDVATGVETSPLSIFDVDVPSALATGRIAQ